LEEKQLLISRRDWLSMTAVNGLACLAVAGRSSAGQRAARSKRTARGAVRSREHRILGVIQAYEKQGFHRTGTAVDRDSGNWLFDEVRQAGLTPSRESFALDRVDPLSAVLAAGDRRIEGLPLFDGAFTDEHGVRGRLGSLGSDAEIGLTETVPNAAGAGPLGNARRKGGHKAIVCTTRGGRPGLCPSNADSFLQPFGPPVLQVASEHAAWLADCARQGVEAQVIAHARRTPAEAFNVSAKVTSADPALPPLVIMTPRSGWYWCASERGGGIACWLELMRVMRDAKPAREVVFVASSGHELGHLGITAFVDRRPGIVATSVGWMHFGANIGAAIGPGNAARPTGDQAAGLPPSASLPRATGNTVQASDDELENMLGRAMTSAGLSIDVRNPRGTIPGGEAEVVHRGGGRYVSVIGRNALFHNPEDRGPQVVDAHAIAAFVDAFTIVAKTLAGREGHR
jgi:hypothetical protein